MAMGIKLFEQKLTRHILKQTGCWGADIVALLTEEKLQSLYDVGHTAETAFEVLDDEFTQSHQLVLWDKRFLRLAEEISKWSKDPSTKTGAVFVTPERRIIGTGYNGFPSCMDDKPDWWHNREEKYERVIHCEMNAAQNCTSPHQLKGATLYTFPFMSCPRCATHMAGYGIKRVVAPILEPGSDQEARWRDPLKKSEEIFTDCGVDVVLYDVWNKPF